MDETSFSPFFTLFCFCVIHWTQTKEQKQGRPGNEATTGRHQQQGEDKEPHKESCLVLNKVRTRSLTKSPVWYWAKEQTLSSVFGRLSQSLPKIFVWRSYWNTPWRFQLQAANSLSYKQLHEPNACGFHIRYEYDLTMNIGNYLKWEQNVCRASLKCPCKVIVCFLISISYHHMRKLQQCQRHEQWMFSHPCCHL